jgi:hypothetical protein
MSGLAFQYGAMVFVQFKMMVSNFYGFITLLAASCCLDAIRGFSSTSQTDVFDHDGGGAARVGNGNDLARKEAFIANLVANMTVPELGEMLFQ